MEKGKSENVFKGLPKKRGVYVITVIASDGFSSVEKEITIEVNISWLEFGFKLGAIITPLSTIFTIIFRKKTFLQQIL